MHVTMSNYRLYQSCFKLMNLSVLQCRGLAIKSYRRLTDTYPLIGNGQQLSSKQCRWFGQPAAQTHPHLIRKGHLTPGVSAEEYRTRRQKLMELIASSIKSSRDAGVLVVIPSAPKLFMSYDIPYPFRQNTSFFYLCGFLEPDSVLVLESKSALDISNYTATLYVPKRDQHRERWDGPRSGVDGSMYLTGVDAAYNNDDLGIHVDKFLADHQLTSLWYDGKNLAHPEFHHRFFSRLLSELKGRKTVQSPQALLQSLRLIKSPAEVELMKQTCSIASKSFKEVMKFCQPGINESHLYAKMDFECRIRGADYLAYPPVVAGGDRANTIHYIANNQLIADGDMVLMDAGCECHGYTSDITRTWPINGHFSGPQRDLYEALLEVQQSCIAMCCPNGLTANQLYFEMLNLLGRQLQHLGIVPRSKSKNELQNIAREFCPHHVSHYLGMDVHDTDEIPRNIPLSPGMVITVEPGIYIEKSRKDVPIELRGIGMRIEDDVLITESGAYNLSHECPKHPDDIENIMRRSGL